MSREQIVKQILDNARKTGKEAFAPTTLGIRLVEAAVAVASSK